MKKSAFILIITGLALSVGVNAAAAETLSYGTYFRSNHNVITDALQPFFKAVTKETDGSLKFRLLADGTVVGGSDALNGVRDGIVDMATVLDVYVPSQLPTNATLDDLALFPGGTLAGTAAFNEMALLHCEQCTEDWHQVGVQPLAYYSSAPYHLMCVDKVNDVASIAGKRIRTSAAWSEWGATMGGIPVSLSGGEIYAALNRGTVDCTVGPLAFLNTYGLKDVVNYVLDMPMGAFRGVSFLNMRLGKWEGLSDAEKEAIKSQLADAVANAAWSYNKESDEAAKGAREQGIKFVEPGEKMKTGYDTLLKSERERVIALAKKRGIKSPEALVDRYLKLLDKWKKVVADMSSKEQYRVALKKRIFDKAEF